jgi:hypothetical protein
MSSGSSRSIDDGTSFTLSKIISWDALIIEYIFENDKGLHEKSNLQERGLQEGRECKIIGRCKILGKKTERQETIP